MGWDGIVRQMPFQAKLWTYLYELVGNVNTKVRYLIDDHISGKHAAQRRAFPSR